ncbi:MAG: hypothetical protein KF797_11855 [Flavobacteriales bacterium]|nr:hypothetical protein [Flavobacteriales bacterium]
MERERLTRLVQDAAAVERGDLAELHALAERFPWFAGAQVLRSVGVQKAGDVLSEEALRTAAAHVPSRTALFDRVHRETPPIQRLSVVREVPAPSEPIAVAAPTITQHVQAEPAPPTAVEHAPIVEPAVPQETTVAGEPATPNIPAQPAAAGMAGPAPLAERNTHPEADAIQEVEEAVEAIEALHPMPQEPAEAEAERDLDEDPLERQIMESALSHAYDISWLEVEQPKARPEPQRPEPVEIPTPQPVVPIAPIQPAGPARFVTRHDKLSFTDWLSASSEPAPPPPPVARPKEREVPEAAADWLRQPMEKPKPAAPLAPIQPVAEKKGEVDTRSLIDNFIKQQTPATTQKAAFFTPQQAAKRSLDDKAGMVTETLARVYAKQGNVPKAIEAYKRLALKYPEKSAYFAALQKELEAQLNK